SPAGTLVVLALDTRDRRGAGLRRDDPGLRWAGPQDVDLLGSFGHSRATLEARLSRGDRAFVMLEGRELLGYVWFRSGAYDDDGLGVRFRMEPAEVWLYDAMMARRVRGQGLYGRLVEAAAAALEGAGVERIWVAVEA